MNKTEFIDAMAKATGFTKVDTSKFLEAFTGVIKSTLKKTGEVRLVGFGTFKSVKVAERSVRNPQTGKNILVPKHNRPKFVPGKELKESVNK